MEQNNEDRRSFLKQVLAGSAVVAGTALTGKPARAMKKKESEHGDEILYRESDAFKKYYESLR